VYPTGAHGVTRPTLSVKSDLSGQPMQVSTVCLSSESAGLRLCARPLGKRHGAFTLIEMLVVIGIIGILAAIGLPAMKGIGQANVMAAANRQMLDDLTYARFRAISDRTKVYMVFVPPKVYERTQALADPRSRRIGTNLVGGQ